MKISLFKNSFDKKPIKDLAFEEFIDRIRRGYWKKSVTTLRSKLNSRTYKRAKLFMYAVSVSATFHTLEKSKPWEKRIKKPTGLICLDIDKKDNIKLRPGNLIDQDCLAQFVSCSGQGVKIIYRCEPTTDPATHRRIYDAAVKRLEQKGIKLKVDPVVKSIASLQFVSYDPKIFYRPQTKLVIKPLPPIKIKTKKPSDDLIRDITQLDEYIDWLGEKDITENYEDWLTIAFGLAYSLGEHGRPIFHRLSKNYKNYSEEETNEKYDSVLEQNQSNIERPVTIASVFQLINDALPKVKVRHLAKKYNQSHAIGIGEEADDGQQGDLAGMVRYKLFLFKKVVNKETHEIVELIPHTINLNEFERLLREKQFYRYQEKFVHIVDNIVSEVDANDILRIITEHIEKEGDYKFSYNKMEFLFGWEELVHLWRNFRAGAGVHSQLKSSLTRWVPNLLKDELDVSYVPYMNCVVKVTKERIESLPYSQLKQQIWKERIIPRNFTYTKKPGMFEEFFANVCGRGKVKTESKSFNRARWYYGYMLQGAKRRSVARAWLLYDTRPGRNGRTGKTILGEALGKIRSVVVLDGKQIDFRNRFAFQTIQPWTDIVFIDDPSRYMSLDPMFNMITGELHADKKGVDPVVKSVKFVIASNWMLETEGTSVAGRQFVTQLSDFYTEYGKAHGNTITPVVDYHGKEFFTDWDEKDWNQFDSFSMRCLQHHLKAEAPDNVIIGNVRYVRFLQVYDKELFHELSRALIENMRYTKDKKLYVPQRVMIQVIKDSDLGAGRVHSGRVVREFFAAIDTGNVDITTVYVGNLNTTVYRFEKDFPDLYFGEFADNLPRPKLL